LHQTNWIVPGCARRGQVASPRMPLPPSARATGLVQTLAWSRPTRS